jgi:hypothetical protein
MRGVDRMHVHREVRRPGEGGVRLREISRGIRRDDAVRILIQEAYTWATPPSTNNSVPVT